jgi:hypothetical protein
VQNEVEVDDPVILIRVSRLYREGMSSEALYEATRGVWRAAGKKRDQARYAFGVSDGIVRAVYEIAEWYPAATTVYKTRDAKELDTDHRWEFTGTEAAASMLNKYLGRSVAGYFSRGNRNPIFYVNCG